MSDLKRIKNEFEWVPLHEKVGRFGFPLSNKPDYRKPLLRIERTGSDKDNYTDDLFFVNTSGADIELVISGHTGFYTVDDDEQVNLIDKCNYKYENVEDDEAVKIEEYHDIYDSDFMLGIVLYIKSKKLGNLEIQSRWKKGGIGSTVLLWDNGEAGKEVGISEWDIDEQNL